MAELAGLVECQANQVSDTHCWQQRDLMSSNRSLELSRRTLCAMAPIGVIGFWAGMWAASQRFPAEYDWRYMTISSLLYPDRDPDGYVWAWCGVLLCAFGGLCWVIALRHANRATNSRAQSAAVWALGFGYVCMVSCALWPGRLLKLPRGHDLLALLAFVAICIGTVQLTYLAVERNLLRRSPDFRARARVLAAIVAGAGLLPILLEGLTQADVAHAFPHLPWVGLEWRARGVPMYLSFAFWEWSACAVFSVYTVVLATAMLSGVESDCENSVCSRAAL